jgi:hypothetical protein
MRTPVLITLPSIEEVVVGFLLGLAAAVVFVNLLLRLLRALVRSRGDALGLAANSSHRS